METRNITVDWIGRNVELLERAKIVNGLGVPGKWYTKIFKYLLWFTSKKRRSRFYYAFIFHDTLYWAGFNNEDRKYADSIMLKKMYEINMSYLKSNINNNKARIMYSLYTVDAIFCYIMVRMFGRNAFNYLKKKYIEDVYLKIESGK